MEYDDDDCRFNLLPKNENRPIKSPVSVRVCVCVCVCVRARVCVCVPLIPLNRLFYCLCSMVTMATKLFIAVH
jgi:hypothetical protein